MLFDKLLIKFPSRTRGDKFVKVLSAYRGMRSNEHDVRILVTAAPDDPTMNNDRIKSMLEAMPDVWLHYTPHDHKVQAINANVEDHLDWDWDALLLVADDMIPIVQNYDAVILEDLEQHFPSTDGVLWYYDGFQNERLNTIPCMGRAYYERFHYIYHPSYLSLWCDNEFQEVADRLGRQVRFPHVIIRHEHPYNVGGKQDEQLRRTESYNAQDKANYEARRSRNFDLPV